MWYLPFFDLLGPLTIFCNPDRYTISSFWPYKRKHPLILLSFVFGITVALTSTAMDIKTLRLKVGLTQEQLAHKLGVSVVTVNRWEKGRSRIMGLTNYPDYKYARYKASLVLGAAISHNELEPPTQHLCVDCKAPAICYDHRDYFLPLEVEPVCLRCNLRRGPAWATLEKLLSGVPIEGTPPPSLDQQTTTITIRIPTELYNTIAALALEDVRTINAEITYFLLRSLGKPAQD